MDRDTTTKTWKDRDGWRHSCNSQPKQLETTMGQSVTKSLMMLKTDYCINPYSAKGLGYRLYATVHKMPGEVGYSFCLFLKS